jgi:hypothetical protein
MLQPPQNAMRLGSFTHESVTEPYDDGEADSSRLRTQSLSSAVGRAKNAKEQYSFDLPVRKSKDSCLKKFRAQENDHRQVS